MSNGIFSRLRTNLKVCVEEWGNYRVQIAVVMDKVRRSDGLGNKLHHLSGLGPDANRLMSRTLWYVRISLSLILVLLLGWVFFI